MPTIAPLNPTQKAIRFEMEQAKRFSLGKIRRYEMYQVDPLKFSSRLLFVIIGKNIELHGYSEYLCIVLI